MITHSNTMRNIRNTRVIQGLKDEGDPGSEILAGDLNIKNTYAAVRGPSTDYTFRIRALRQNRLVIRTF